VTRAAAAPQQEPPSGFIATLLRSTSEDGAALSRSRSASQTLAPADPGTTSQLSSSPSAAAGPLRLSGQIRPAPNSLAGPRLQRQLATNAAPARASNPSYVFASQRNTRASQEDYVDDLDPQGADNDDGSPDAGSDQSDEDYINDPHSHRDTRSHTGTVMTHVDDDESAGDEAIYGNLDDAAVAAAPPPELPTQRSTARSFGPDHGDSRAGGKSEQSLHNSASVDYARAAVHSRAVSAVEPYAVHTMGKSRSREHRYTKKSPHKQRSSGGSSSPPVPASPGAFVQQYLNWDGINHELPYWSREQVYANIGENIYGELLPKAVSENEGGEEHYMELDRVLPPESAAGEASSDTTRGHTPSYVDAAVLYEEDSDAADESESLYASAIVAPNAEGSEGGAAASGCGKPHSRAPKPGQAVTAEASMTASRRQPASRRPAVEMELRTVSTLARDMEKNPQMLTKVELSGYLWKQGARIKSWRHRWCVLRNGTLRYYESKAACASGADPFGTISIDGTFRVVLSSNVRREHTFEIVTPGRTYLFSAETYPDMKRWMTELQHAMRRTTLMQSHIKRGMVIHEGWMYKSSRGKLSRRFFALYDTRLVYFQDEKKRPALGQIDVAAALLENIIDEECSDPDDETPSPASMSAFRFCLVTPSATYYFSTATPEEKDAWMFFLILVSEVHW
jgi:hypothetical protein